MKIKKTIKMFEPGQTVVITGETAFDREIVVYNDPVSFVETIANSKKKSEKITNQEFMFNVSSLLKDADITIPHHNEEAFVSALIKVGICSPAILN